MLTIQQRRAWVRDVIEFLHAYPLVFFHVEHAITNIFASGFQDIEVDFSQANNFDQLIFVFDVHQAVIEMLLLSKTDILKLLVAELEQEETLENRQLLEQTQQIMEEMLDSVLPTPEQISEGVAQHLLSGDLKGKLLTLQSKGNLSHALSDKSNQAAQAYDALFEQLFDEVTQKPLHEVISIMFNEEHIKQEFSFPSSYQKNAQLEAAPSGDQSNPGNATTKAKQFRLGESRRQDKGSSSEVAKSRQNSSEQKPA